MKRGLLTLVVGLAAWGSAAQAHHSIASVYDSARQVTIDAVVTQFHFVNPHPFVMAQVTDRTGTARPWRLEMDNRWELADVGMTSATFQPGDRIVVSGSLARSEPQHLYIRRLERPADGFTYEQVGTRPRVIRGRR